MSLKAFHIVFITASTILSFAFGAWSVSNSFSPAGTLSDAVMGWGSVACGLALIVYGVYFLRKLKHISYL